MSDNLTGIKKVLCAMGTADTKVLAECPPNEQLKYSMSAIFNVNQALISGSAMAFTLYSINKAFPVLLILFLSTFWGFVCFMLGFGLVGSVTKAKQGKAKGSLAASLAIRLAITIVISLLTSQVLELYIFKDYFPLARRKQQILALQTFENSVNSKVQELEVLKGNVDMADQEIQSWHESRMAMFSDDPILKDMLQQREFLNTRLVSLNNQYRELNRVSADRISSAQRSISTLAIERDNLLQLETLSNNEATRLRNLNSQIASFNETVAHENRERNRRNTEISSLERNIANQQAAIDERRQLIDVDNRDRTQALTAKRDMAASAYAQAETELAEFIAENEKASSATFLHEGSLINDLITLKFIQGWRNDPEATYEEKATAVKVMQIRFLVMALFLIMDLAPFLVILLHKKGKYEALKEAELETANALIAIETQQKIQQGQIEMQAHHKFMHNQIESERIVKEAETLTKQSKSIYDVLCRARAEAMQSIYLVNDDSNLGVDTENIIKDILQNTQREVTLNLFASRDRTHMNFTKDVNNDDDFTYQPSVYQYNYSTGLYND